MSLQSAYRGRISRVVYKALTDCVGIVDAQPTIKMKDVQDDYNNLYDNPETASKPGQFEPGKSEKNRRNLELIQTCDFFYFVHFVYNFL